MMSFPRSPRWTVTVLSIALATGAALAGMAVAGPRGEPASCEIRAEAQGGATALTALVRSDRSLTGSYSFKVRSAGRGGGTNIAQSGDFKAAAGRPVTLGSVTVGGDEAGYDTRLDLDLDGGRVSCSRRISGGI